MPLASSKWLRCSEVITSWPFDAPAVGGRNLAPAVHLVERVLVLVDVDALDVGEGDRVGTVGERRAEEVGMEDLQRGGFPAAGRSAGQDARVGLANDAEALLDLGNQLLHDRVAVRADVDRVHGVGVVEVRIRMLERDGDHAREVVAQPRLRELVLSRRSRTARRARSGPGCSSPDSCIVWRS